MPEPSLDQKPSALHEITRRLMPVGEYGARTIMYATALGAIAIIGVYSTESAAYRVPADAGHARLLGKTLGVVFSTSERLGTMTRTAVAHKFSLPKRLFWGKIEILARGDWQIHRLLQALV